MKGKHTVNGMSFHAFHGVLEVERELGQVFSVDAVLDFEMDQNDTLPKAEPVVKDADVYEITRNVMTETKYRSITSLAGKIAHDILTNYPRVDNATVSIAKRQLFIPGNVEKVVEEVSYSRKDLDSKAKG
jgi:dihydroneopterin aldolase